MELHVWPSDFGLPSIDPHCLQFLSCAKMCASPISVVPSTTPWNSPSGEYPQLVDRTKNDFSKSITDFDRFVDILRKSGQDVIIDGDLTVAEKSKIDAFACYLAQHLYPALHTMWVDELNYNTVTQYWYSNHLSFPYNMYYLERRKKRASRFLQTQNVSKIMANALQAINMLSAKLDDNKYMCGNKPSSLDALVFGYLAPLLRLPYPNDRLKLHLSACPNLARFVESISSIYLPLTDDQLKKQRHDAKIWEQRLQNAEKAKEAEKAAKNPEAEQQQEDLPLRDTVLFGLGAITLSILFALHSGIIQSKFIKATFREVRDNGRSGRGRRTGNRRGRIRQKK